MLEEKLVQNNGYSIVWNKVDQYFICSDHDIESYNAYLVSVSYNDFLDILDENYLQLQDKLLNGLEPIDLWKNSQIIYENNFPHKVFPIRNEVELDDKKLTFLEVTQALSKLDNSLRNKFLSDDSLQDVWLELLHLDDTKYFVIKDNQFLNHNAKFINTNKINEDNIEDYGLTYTDFIKLYPELINYYKLESKNAEENWNMMKKTIDDGRNNVLGFKKNNQDKVKTEDNNNVLKEAQEAKEDIIDQDSSVINDANEAKLHEEENSKVQDQNQYNDEEKHQENNQQENGSTHVEEKEDKIMDNNAEHTISLNDEAFKGFNEIKETSREKFGVNLTDSQVIDYLLFELHK